MKYGNLTKRDLREIWDLAHREWLHNAEKDKELLLCQSYTKAFCGWLAAKKLSIINGKIVDETADKAQVQQD